MFVELCSKELEPSNAYSFHMMYHADMKSASLAYVINYRLLEYSVL